MLAPSRAVPIQQADCRAPPDVATVADAVKAAPEGPSEAPAITASSADAPAPSALPSQGSDVPADDTYKAEESPQAPNGQSLLPPATPSPQQQPDNVAILALLAGLPLQGGSGTLPPLCGNEGAAPTGNAGGRKPGRRPMACARAPDGKPLGKQTIELNCARCGPTRTPMRRHHHTYGNADLCNACGVCLRRLDQRHGRHVSSSGDDSPPSGGGAHAIAPAPARGRKGAGIGRGRRGAAAAAMAGPPPSAAEVAAAQATLSAAKAAEREAIWSRQRRSAFCNAAQPLQLTPDAELDRRFQSALQRCAASLDQSSGPRGLSMPSMAAHVRVNAFVAAHAPHSRTERLPVTVDGRDVAGRVADERVYTRVYGFQPGVLARMTEPERASAVVPAAPQGKKARAHAARRVRLAAVQVAQAQLVLQRARVHPPSGGTLPDLPAFGNGPGSSRGGSNELSPVSAAAEDPPPDAAAIKHEPVRAPLTRAAATGVQTTAGAGGTSMQANGALHGGAPTHAAGSTSDLAALAAGARGRKRKPLPPLSATPPPHIAQPQPAQQEAAQLQSGLLCEPLQPASRQMGSSAQVSGGAVKRSPSPAVGSQSEADSQGGKRLRTCALCRAKTELARDGFCKCAHADTFTFCSFEVLSVQIAVRLFVDHWGCACL